MPSATPRPAATVLLLRENQNQIEIFLQRRNPKATFVGGVYVFPGGKVDTQDGNFPEHCLSLPAADANILQQRGGLTSIIAAIRECFEESGILLATHADGSEINNDAFNHSNFEKNRQAVLNQERTFADFCQEHEFKLAIDQMAYLSQWITPEPSPIRFDTHFFVSPMPNYQQGNHDGYESVESVWWTPSEALEKQAQGDIQLILPTIRSLQQIRDFNQVTTAMDYFKANQPTPTSDPKLLSLDGQIELVQTPSLKGKS